MDPLTAAIIGSSVLQTGLGLWGGYEDEKEARAAQKKADREQALVNLVRAAQGAPAIPGGNIGGGGRGGPDYASALAGLTGNIVTGVAMGEARQTAELDKKLKAATLGIDPTQYATQEAYQQAMLAKAAERSATANRIATQQDALQTRLLGAQVTEAEDPVLALSKKVGAMQNVASGAADLTGKTIANTDAARTSALVDAIQSQPGYTEAAKVGGMAAAMAPAADLQNTISQYAPRNMDQKSFVGAVLDLLKTDPTLTVPDAADRVKALMGAGPGGTGLSAAGVQLIPL